MKKHQWILLILSLSLFSHPSYSQQDAFMEKWRTSQQYILYVAEAMPKSTNHFSPISEELMFAEQLMLIAVIIDRHGFSKVDGQQ
jgi:hypothetical protein